MSDAILPLLLCLTAALFIAGCAAPLLPRPAAGFLPAAICAAGVLLLLAAVLGRSEAVVVQFAAGPPGLALAFALDPLSALFLLVALCCGGTVLTYTAVSAESAGELTAAALIIVGIIVVLLAAEATLLTLGLWLTACGLWLSTGDKPPWPIMLAAVLALISLCLMAPDGAASDFGAIAAAPAGQDRGLIVVLTSLAAGLALLLPASSRATGSGSFLAGALVLAGVYLLTRLLVELPGTGAHAWCGVVLMLTGATFAILFGWRAVGHADLRGAVDALVRLQAATACVALGICMVGKASDLSEAACFACAAELMLILVGAGLAGTAAAIAAAAIARSAGSSRLSRLGGLVERMPLASAALAVSLLALAAVPPSVGFAGIWLLLQAFLSAPRTGGLAAQIPLAAAAAAVTAAAGLATASAVRLSAIALLGRPRSAGAAAAVDIARNQWPILAALPVVSVLIGLLPGVMLAALAQQTLAALTGAGLGTRAGWMILSASPAIPGYASLPVLALLLLAACAVMLVTRRYQAGRRLSASWADGLQPAANLPFGEPTAQSAGSGFRPLLPDLPRVTLPAMPRIELNAIPTARAGLWIVLCALGLLLFAALLSQGGGT